MAMAQPIASAEEGDTSNRRRRPIRPLPKRQRLTADTTPPAPTTPTIPTLPLLLTDDQPSPADDDHLVFNSASIHPILPTNEYRSNAHLLDAAHPPLHTRPPSLALHSDDSDYPDADEIVDTLPATPDDILHGPSLHDAIKHHEPSFEKPPSYFPLFGPAGDDLIRALANASAFSRAGLFGGLGLAALHPSLAREDEEDEYDCGDHDHDHDHDVHDHDGECEDEEGFGEEDVSDQGDVRRKGGFRFSRSHHDHSSRSCGAAHNLALLDGSSSNLGESNYRASGGGGVIVTGGNNKKKRKIPGVTHGVAGDEDERGFDDEIGGNGEDEYQLRSEEAEPLKPPLVGAPGLFGVSKVPANLPTTAAAALRKLAQKPPHISLHPLTSTYRRHQTLLYHSQPPLHLPSRVIYIPPPKSAAGLAPPPPLPPGSGLKGSKALKAAKKAEKDREKENIRIKAVLEGETGIKLYHFWWGKAGGPEVATKQRVKVASGKPKPGPIEAYPTPPPSSDEGDDASSCSTSMGITLDEFSFESSTSNVIKARWLALANQIVRIKEAKERAEKARLEELERKREKEREEEEELKRTMAAGKNKHAGNGTKEGRWKKNANLPLPSTSSTTSSSPSSSTTVGASKRPQQHPSTTATLHPPVEPLSDRSPNTPSPTPTSSSLTPSTSSNPKSSTAPSTASPPPPPPPPPPLLLKKGGTKKKKRSAHANALNSHHRDNYVPSRMPTSSSHGHSSGGGGGGGGGNNDSSPNSSGIVEGGLLRWPASEAAVAAAGGGEGSSSFYGSDEWMCGFCEYALWFGTEQQMAKVISKRKKVLKVRRKARERAAKATGATGETA